MSELPNTFQSKYGAYQILVRPERRKYNDSGDVLLDVTPPLTLEFAKHIGEHDYVRPDGEQDKWAEIQGFFANVEEQGAEKGWSADEIEMVKKVTLDVTKRFPGDVWVWEAPKIEAPWPKYDETHHNQIPVLAEQLGLVGAALEYERQNKKRQALVAKLEEMLAAEQAADEELSAA